MRSGEWQMVDFDPLTQTTTWIGFDDDSYYVKTDTVVDGRINTNTECRSANDRGWAEDVHLVAAIPQHIFYETDVREAAMVHDEAYMKRWLNDSDNASWRTKEGTI